MHTTTSAPSRHLPPGPISKHHGSCPCTLPGTVQASREMSHQGAITPFPLPFGTPSNWLWQASRSQPRQGESHCLLDRGSQKGLDLPLLRKYCPSFLRNHLLLVISCLWQLLRHEIISRIFPCHPHLCLERDLC